MDEKRFGSILYLGTYGGEWSTLHPGLFNFGAAVPGTDRTGGNMSPPQATFDTSEWENPVSSTGTLQTNHASSSVVWPVAKSLHRLDNPGPFLRQLYYLKAWLIPPLTHHYTPTNHWIFNFVFSLFCSSVARQMLLEYQMILHNVEGRLTIDRRIGKDF
jgi:hypothetical protein